MILIKRGNNTVQIKYFSVHGNAFGLKIISESAFAKQYRILEKYVPDGIYKNEILDILASIFNINIRDQKWVDVVLEGTRSEVEKLRVSE